MADTENERDNEEESGGFFDWFEEAAGFWVGACVITASLGVPVACWIAAKFFGWQPPEFIQEWIDYFAA